MQPILKPHVLPDDVIRKLTRLKIGELSNFIDEMEDDNKFTEMTFVEKFEFIINRLYQNKMNESIQRLKNASKIRDKYASIAGVYYDPQRGLSRDLVLNLGTCDFLKNQTNLVVKGPTGSGKTFIACAIANAAMERCYRAKYIRLPDLTQEIEETIALKRSLKNLKKRYITPSILIIDEWLLRPIAESTCTFLLDVIDARHTESSTIVCTQFNVEDWHESLGGTTQAEAIIDRIVQNSIELNMGTFNMRALKSPTKQQNNNKK